MRYFVVKKLNKWENTKLEQSPDGLPLPFQVEMKAAKDGCIGYLPVYDDIEKALEYAEGNIGLIKPIQTST